MHSVGRGSMTEAVIAVVAAVDVDTSRGVSGIVIDGILHLAQKVVNLDKVFLCPCVWHGQIVLLGQGILRDGRTGADGTSNVSRLGHVLLSSGHGSIGQSHGAM